MSRAPGRFLRTRPQQGCSRSSPVSVPVNPGCRGGGTGGRTQRAGLQPQAPRLERTPAARALGGTDFPRLPDGDGRQQVPLKKLSSRRPLGLFRLLPRIPVLKQTKKPGGQLPRSGSPQ